MGGVVSKVPLVKEAFKSGPIQQAVAEAKAAESPKASRMDEEQGARIRGARRRGRQLLSDARLNPEAGIETLGGGNNLG
jgi:hypothetical protein